MKEDQARTFAATAHGAINQRRKYTGLPYIIHPISVAELVRCVPHTVEMLCAALLHDTVEDTGVCLETIQELFGEEVARLVEQLTDVSGPLDGNRKQRKAIDLAHTAQASPAAKTIKLADLIDNTKDITLYDPKFAITYLKEKELLLEVLAEGDPTLYEIALKQIEAINKQQLST